MHLSILSDTGLLGTAGHGDTRRPSGRAHRDGLIRGLAFLAAIALPLTLAIATGHAGQRDPSAGYAQSFDMGR